MWLWFPLGGVKSDGYARKCNVSTYFVVVLPVVSPCLRVRKCYRTRPATFSSHELSDISLDICLLCETNVHPPSKGCLSDVFFTDVLRSTRIAKRIFATKACVGTVPQTDISNPKSITFGSLFRVPILTLLQNRSLAKLAASNGVKGPISRKRVPKFNQSSNQIRNNIAKT